MAKALLWAVVLILWLSPRLTGAIISEKHDSFALPVDLDVIPDSPVLGVVTEKLPLVLTETGVLCVTGVLFIAGVLLEIGVLYVTGVLFNTGVLDVTGVLYVTGELVVELTSEIGLARVESRDIVQSLSGWSEACQAPDSPITEVRRAFYRSSNVPQGVETDSMMSVSSTVLPRRPWFAPPVVDPADGEGEPDKHMKYLKQFAQQSQGRWAEDEGEKIGMNNLRRIFKPPALQREAAPSTTRQTAPASSTDDWIGPGNMDDRCSALRARFRARPQKDLGDSGLGSVKLRLSWPRRADPPMLSMLMKMELALKTDRDGGDTGDKALRRVHAIRRRCKEQPEKVVSTYSDEVMERLGAEPGYLWQPCMMTLQIHRGNMAGLRRVHFHLSQAPALFLRDLLYKQTCGGTKEGLEALVAYTESMKKLKTAASVCVSEKDKKAKGKGKGDQDPGNV